MVIIVMIQLMHFLFPFSAVMELFSSKFSFSLNLSLTDGQSQSLNLSNILCHFMFLCSFNSVCVYIYIYIYIYWSLSFTSYLNLVSNFLIVSIWSLTFSVTRQFSSCHYPLDGKSWYVKWNSKTIYFIPYQLVLLHQIFFKNPTSKVHAWDL